MISRMTLLRALGSIGLAISASVASASQPSEPAMAKTCTWCTNSCYEALWYCIYECSDFSGSECKTKSCTSVEGAQYLKTMYCNGSSEE